jgi:SAM-dependent methyltransferase
VFNGVDDDEWFAVNTTAYRRYPVLRQFLPAMPSEDIQKEFIGSAGDTALREAYYAYRLFKEVATKYRGRVGPETKVLDFGCGWGRILRFFMRDVRPENLYGVDTLPLAIELCKQTNPLCQFKLINALPPTDFPDNTFDLIYLYSVFSHLSEDAHNRWLTEFHRIMKPGGVLVATTWQREYIERCERARQGATGSEVHSLSYKAFPDAARALAAYDTGDFCHSPVGASLGLSDSFYGETCIPAAYVEKHWTDRFKLREYLYAGTNERWQNVIVVQK